MEAPMRVGAIREAAFQSWVAAALDTDELPQCNDDVLSFHTTVV